MVSMAKCPYCKKEVEKNWSNVPTSICVYMTDASNFFERLDVRRMFSKN